MRAQHGCRRAAESARAAARWRPLPRRPTRSRPSSAPRWCRRWAATRAAPRWRPWGWMATVPRWAARHGAEGDALLYKGWAGGSGGRGAGFFGLRLQFLQACSCVPPSTLPKATPGLPPHAHPAAWVLLAGDSAPGDGRAPGAVWGASGRGGLTQGGVVPPCCAAVACRCFVTVGCWRCWCGRELPLQHSAEQHAAAACTARV